MPNNPPGSHSAPPRTDPVRKDLVPRRRSSSLRTLGNLILRVTGWRIKGSLPNRSKFLVIAAPHTSNWDFVVGMAATLALDVDARWIGKHTLFRRPFGGFMRWLGGVPVDRDSPSGVVDQVVKAYQGSESFVFGLAPEGTRRSVDRWKSGFYRIAFGADVPIVCAYFDYDARVVGIGPVVTPSGDYDADLTQIMEFYRPIRGKSGMGVSSP